MGIPLYGVSIERHVSHSDLSINCMSISLAAIKRVIDGVLDEQRRFVVTPRVYEAIKGEIHGVPSYDILRHFKEKRLTATLDLVLRVTPQVHFWRVVKFGSGTFTTSGSSTSSWCSRTRTCSSNGLP